MRVAPVNRKQRSVCSRYARTKRRENTSDTHTHTYTCIYVSNGAIIRVKLIRHLRNGDCGTNEVHVKPIIRLEFPAVAAKYARRVSGEITRAAGDCLRFDLPASPTVCQGDRRRIRGTRKVVARCNMAPNNPPRDRRRISGWALLNKAIEIESANGCKRRDGCSFRLTRYRGGIWTAVQIAQDLIYIDLRRLVGGKAKSETI